MRGALGALRRGFAPIALVLAMLAPAAYAQPAGWSYVQSFWVRENSGAVLSNYQFRMTIDTAAMVLAGNLRVDGADLRFGTAAGGGTLLDYWIESGINTPTTVVWVRLPSLPASGLQQFFYFGGNAGAASASTLNTFDYVDPVVNSATNQVFGGVVGGVGDSQRGFRFRPNEDVLLTELGKNEPNGTVRYITLFDGATQAVLAQLQIAGPAGSYSYQPLPAPVWLVAGQEYLLQIHQAAADGYYYGNSSQINPRLTYLDMRYCNGCNQNTFPTNFLNNFHYGYPDFQFRSRQQVAPAPTLAAAPVAAGVEAVPTLSEWAVIVLGGLMVLAAAGALRRRA